MQSNHYILILICILLLGVFLRIYGLDTESIWLDEGISLRLAEADPAVATVERALNNHPPLYFILLHYWTKAFGNSVFSARMLSVLFGFLSMLLIYKTGCMLFDRKTGILSALLLGISLFHIYYSQEIRMYSMVSFLALCSVYFFIRLLEDKKPKAAIGYIVSTAFLLYIHYSGFLLILIQNVYLVILILRHRNESALSFKNWLKYQLVLFILYLPWLWIGIIRLTKIQSASLWLSKPTASVFSDSIMEYSGSIFLFIIFTVLLLYGIFRVIKNRMYLFLCLWFIIPIGILFGISYISKPLYLTKYTIISSLAFYILIAVSIGSIKKRYIKVLAISAILVFSAINFRTYYTQINHIPWSIVTSYVEDKAKPGDILIFNDILCYRHVFSRYFEREDVRAEVLPQALQSAQFIAVDDDSVEDLRKIAEGHKRIWIIISHTVDKNKLIESAFFNSYKLLYHKVYPVRSYYKNATNDAAEIFLFEKRQRGQNEA